MIIRLVRSVKENFGNLVLYMSVSVAIIIFILYPIAVVIVETFKTSNGYGFDNYLDYFNDPFYTECFFNSILLTLGVVFTTTLVGVPLAYILSRYKIRLKSLATSLCGMAIVMPPFVGAFAFVILLGLRGMINLLLAEWGLISNPINFLYGVHGVILIETITLFPFITLSVLPAIGGIDASLEEAAEIEGASGLRRFLTVTFPLIRPSYMAGAFFVFVFTLADWLTPMVVGQTRFLAPNAYINVAYQFMDIHRRRMGMISCVLTSLLSIVALLATRKYVELKSYVATTKGTTIEGRVFDLSGLKKVAIHALIVVVIVITLLSPFTVAIGAFSKGWSLSVLPSEWSTKNFEYIFIQTPKYIQNSFIYSGLALLIGLMLGLSMAYLLARTEIPGKNLLDAITTMTLTLPGILIGMGYMIGFGGEMPLLGVSLARVWVVMPIIIAARRLPYMVRSTYASFLQLDKSLEEASEIEGASRFRTFFNISLPLIRRGVFAGALIMFIMSMQEMSATIFVYKVGWETMTIGIFNLWWRGGEFTSFALSVVLIVTTGLIMYIASKMGERILGGTVTV